MDPLAGVTDRRLHDVDEGGHVVIGDRFALDAPAATKPLVDDGRPVAAGGGVGRGHDAQLGVRFRGEQLDLEPAARAWRRPTRSPDISGVE